jgi:hypothetical protein
MDYFVIISEKARMIPWAILRMLKRASINYPVREEFPTFTKRLIISSYASMCAGNVPGVRCLKQGVVLPPHLRAVDHIVPSRAGGLPIFTNGQILCLDCHAHKSLMENRIFPKKGSITKYKYDLAKKWVGAMFNEKVMLKFRLK